MQNVGAGTVCDAGFENRKLLSLVASLLGAGYWLITILGRYAILITKFH